MCPEDDVRAVAGRGNLWEFLFQFVRVLNSDFDPGVFLEFFAYFSEAVIAFVAVNPDNQLTFFNLGEPRRKTSSSLMQTMRGCVRQF
ncbi:hypothetical protein [Citrobacter freundii]|uniref:hypothetical protein n=1 Tax=Citrobacter freundii TaxID=546 RepID=UPI00388F0DFF